MSKEAPEQIKLRWTDGPGSLKVLASPHVTPKPGAEAEYIRADLVPSFDRWYEERTAVDRRIAELEAENERLHKAIVSCPLAEVMAERDALQEAYMSDL